MMIASPPPVVASDGHVSGKLAMHRVTHPARVTCRSSTTRAPAENRGSCQSLQDVDRSSTEPGHGELIGRRWLHGPAACLPGPPGRSPNCSVEKPRPPDGQNHEKRQRVREWFDAVPIAEVCQPVAGRGNQESHNDKGQNRPTGSLRMTDADAVPDQIEHHGRNTSLEHDPGGVGKSHEVNSAASFGGRANSARSRSRSRKPLRPFMARVLESRSVSMQ